MTNASFKQWVGILLMPKIDRAHKNYLTPEIWEETHLREIFYGTLIFQQSSMICIGRHVGGHAFALQHGGQNYFLLISCSTFHIYAQMCIFGTNCLISMASSLTSSLSILNIWWHGGLTAMLLWRNKTIYISSNLQTAEAFPVIASLPPKIASANPSG